MIYRPHSGRNVRGTVPCTLENLGECYFQILCRYIIHNNIMRTEFIFQIYLIFLRICKYFYFFIIFLSDKKMWFNKTYQFKIQITDYFWVKYSTYLKTDKKWTLFIIKIFTITKNMVRVWKIKKSKWEDFFLLFQRKW